MNSSAG